MFSTKIAKLKEAGAKLKIKGGVKKVASVLMSIMIVCSCAVFAFAEGTATTPVQYSDFSSIFEALQGQISVGSIVGVLAAVVGACVGLVFMWWGLRKVVSMLMAAFRKGKMKV